ncbi:MAG TPA: hypothetical protein PKN99_03845 [Cyclobacteriaceae bacterium]|nr:hypothetical protein [Cyclobacteriaceae bacterium]HNP06728.1 hypothetical protein [Cyclobacteriaceae bacterium]HRK55753.1 hypothetical protein [Cyclobacteriaceae bacterium]
MIKVLSIQLAFVVLIGGLIDLHDVAKIPYLIDHYNQHKSKDTAFSITEFFELHYGSMEEEHDKEESEQHKGLPFKAPDNTSIHSTVFFVAGHNTSVELDEIEVTYTNFYHSHSSSEFQPSIFQPPRKG